MFKCSGWLYNIRIVTVYSNKPMGTYYGQTKRSGLSSYNVRYMTQGYTHYDTKTK